MKGKLFLSKKMMIHSDLIIVFFFSSQKVKLVLDGPTQKIVYMIVTDHQPLSIVELKGFSELKFLVPHYKLPSRQTITRLTDAKYNVMKIAIKKQLALTPFHAITCDIWTDCKMQSYLGVTDYYLTPDFVLNHIILGTIPLTSNHTGDLIEEKLGEVLSAFDIELEKVVCVVSNSAGNMKKGIVQLVGSKKHVSCVAHILSHIMPDALQSLTSINDILLDDSLKCGVLSKK